MSRRERQIVITVVVAVIASIVGVISYAVYQFNEVGMKSVKTMSNVAQSQHAVQQYLSDHPRWAEERLALGAGDKVTLDRERAADLLRDAATAYGADPAVPDDVSLDAWRRPLCVSFRRESTGPVRFTIVSFGYDGTEGTADDIVFSSDEPSVPTTHPTE